MASPAPGTVKKVGDLYYKMSSSGKWFPVGSSPYPVKQTGTHTWTMQTPYQQQLNAGPQAASAPPPVDTEFEQRKARAQRDYSTYIGDSDTNLRRTASDYGFSYDPSTGARGGVDTSNPYSRAALLQKSYNQGKERSQRTFDVGTRGNLNSMAARGQLYSGALRRRQAEQQRQFGERTRSLVDAYNQGDDQLRRTFDAFVEQWLRGRRNAATTLQDVLAGAVPEYVGMGNQGT